MPMGGVDRCAWGGPVGAEGFGADRPAEDDLGARASAPTPASGQGRSWSAPYGVPLSGRVGSGAYGS